MISYPLVLGTVAGLSFMLLSAGFALWKRKRYLPAILAGAMLAGPIYLLGCSIWEHWRQGRSS